MADEKTHPPFNRPNIVPGGLDWATLHRLDGDPLEVQYRHTLAELGKQPGTLGVIFRKAQNKIQDPAKLKRLVSDLIEKEQWMILDADVKGDAYEGLLAKNAEDVKSGAEAKRKTSSWGGASSSRHEHPAKRGGSSSRRPCGAMWKRSHQLPVMMNMLKLITSP